MSGKIRPISEAPKEIILEELASARLALAEKEKELADEQKAVEMYREKYFQMKSALAQAREGVGYLLPLAMEAFDCAAKSKDPENPFKCRYSKHSVARSWKSSICPLHKEMEDKYTALSSLPSAESPKVGPGVAQGEKEPCSHLVTTTPQPDGEQFCLDCRTYFYPQKALSGEAPQKEEPSVAVCPKSGAEFFLRENCTHKCEEPRQGEELRP